MVINHLEKLFVTSDTATVIQELEVEHPAAKMIVMATKMMEQEVRSDIASTHTHIHLNPCCTIAKFSRCKEAVKYPPPPSPPLLGG